MKTLFCHTELKTGERFTVAGLINEKELSLGISLCSPKDAFQKRTGRNKAEGRAKAGKTILEVPIIDKRYRDIKNIRMKFYEEIGRIRKIKFEVLKNIIRKMNHKE